MILTIDTAQKTIEIKSSYNLGVLIKQLSEMFPDGAWKEYSIQDSSHNIWSQMNKYPPIYSAPLSSPTITPYSNPIVGPGTYTPSTFSTSP